MITQLYNNYWDLLVNNRSGQPTLIVEVKSKIGTFSAWVAKLRRNILAHGIVPSTPYFLIAFPDKFYLWKHNTKDNLSDEREPDYIIDASPILQPYFQEIGIQDNQIRESSLEIIIASWLNEIMYSEKTIEKIKTSQGWLINSGLYSALTGGKVNHEVKA
jgi:hypothetical protein